MPALVVPVRHGVRLQCSNAAVTDLPDAAVLKTDSARSRRTGIALVTLSTFCFGVLDASAKWLVQGLPVVEVVWLRFATHFVLMLALLAPLHGRALFRMHSPRLHLLRSAAGAALVLAPLALLQWQAPPDALSWGLIGLCGLMGGLGHLAVAMAHRYASAAVLGPFLYQQILYMALWGWLVFSQVPDAFVVAGSLVVVLSGLYLLWMEWRRA